LRSSACDKPFGGEQRVERPRIELLSPTGSGTDRIDPGSVLRVEKPRQLVWKNFLLTGIQPACIPYFKDIEYINVKLAGCLKTAVLVSPEEAGSNEAIDAKSLRHKNLGGSSP
jgi:hypothetical protein